MAGGQQSVKSFIPFWVRTAKHSGRARNMQVGPPNSQWTGPLARIRSPRPVNVRVIRTRGVTSERAGSRVRVQAPPLGRGSTHLEKHPGPRDLRSEEHTSELQSQSNLVCRLLLEKK